MGKLVTSVTINRPVEDVWRFFLDLDNINKWDSWIRKAEQISEGPFARGTIIAMHTSIGPLKFVRRVVVTELEQYRLIVFGVADRGRLARLLVGSPEKLVTRFVFERVGNATRFTKDQDRPGLVSLIDRLMDKKRQEWFAELKRLLEAPARQPEVAHSAR